MEINDECYCDFKSRRFFGSKETAHDPICPQYVAQAYLEDLAQWADAAVELFPVHGERFQEIARVLRAGAAQAPQEPFNPDTETPIEYIARLEAILAMRNSDIDELRRAAQAALNPGMREALERIRDFPIGGRTAAGAMALIARQALQTGE
jgi:hypothetical protein